MADELIDVSPDWAKRAYVDAAKYKAMYEASIEDPAKFWGEHGKRIDWIKPYSPGAVRDVDYTGNVHIRWYDDGVLNVSANCVDRHLAKRADQVAIIWEGDDPAKIEEASPTASCTAKSAAWPMCSRNSASRRATGSPSTCR